MCHKLTAWFFLLLAISSIGQGQSPKEQGLAIIKELSKPGMYGRGYVKRGDLKAAQYIEEMMRSFNAEKVWTQSFPIDVVCFKTSPLLKLNGKTLNPGYDFTLSAGQKLWVQTYTRRDIGRKIWVDSTKNHLLPSLRLSSNLPAVTYAQRFSNDSLLFLRSEVLPRKIKRIKISVKPTLQQDLMTQNVIAFLDGESDSTIVVCAHYDHLGAYGDACYFPGSLDNASGVALMLGFLKSTAPQKHNLKHNVAFIAFGAEEVGLLGSKYFVENASTYFDLKKVVHVINLDLVGTGKEGIVVENAMSKPELFSALIAKNEKENWFSQIKSRENRPNSDHFPFSQKEIPAYFIYTLGEAKEYHNVHDNLNNVTLSKWDELLAMLNFMVFGN